MSTLALLGLGMLTFSIGSLMITFSPYTKVKDPVTGITTITVKETGRKFIIVPGGYPKEI